MADAGEAREPNYRQLNVIACLFLIFVSIGAGFGAAQMWPDEDLFEVHLTSEMLLWAFGSIAVWLASVACGLLSLVYAYDLLWGRSKA